MKQLQKIDQESMAAWLAPRNVFEKQQTLKIAAEFSTVICTVWSVGCRSLSVVSGNLYSKGGDQCIIHCYYVFQSGVRFQIVA